MTDFNNPIVHIGEVVWFKGVFGFIAYSIDGSPQKDMFVHYSDISKKSCTGFRRLKQGQKVSFEVGTNNSGEPKAINVIIL